MFQVSCAISPLKISVHNITVSTGTVNHKQKKRKRKLDTLTISLVICSTWRNKQPVCFSSPKKRQKHLSFLHNIWNQEQRLVIWWLVAGAETTLRNWLLHPISFYEHSQWDAPGSLSPTKLITVQIMWHYVLRYESLFKYSTSVQTESTNILWRHWRAIWDSNHHGASTKSNRKPHYRTHLFQLINIRIAK